MAMSPPTPHTCSTTRVTRGEQYTAPAAVLSEEPCLISPWQPGESQNSFMGPMEVNRYVLFIGYDADIEKGDEVTNDATGEKFVVIEAPVKFQNPSDNFSNDHQQVLLRKSPVIE